MLIVFWPVTSVCHSIHPFITLERKMSYVAMYAFSVPGVFLQEVHTVAYFGLQDSGS